MEEGRVSITPIEPLAVPHIGPMDDDWFEDDDTPEPEYDTTCGLAYALLGAPTREL